MFCQNPVFFFFFLTCNTFSSMSPCKLKLSKFNARGCSYIKKTVSPSLSTWSILYLHICDYRDWKRKGLLLTSHQTTGKPSDKFVIYFDFQILTLKKAQWDHLFWDIGQAAQTLFLYNIRKLLFSKLSNLQNEWDYRDIHALFKFFSLCSLMMFKVQRKKPGWVE